MAEHKLSAAQVEILIAALQSISRMAPRPDVPDLEDMDDLDPDQIEGLSYDLGLYEAAEIGRTALTEVGVEPEPGTTQWYQEGSYKLTDGRC